MSGLDPVLRVISERHRLTKRIRFRENTSVLVVRVSGRLLERIRHGERITVCIDVDVPSLIPLVAVASDIMLGVARDDGREVGFVLSADVVPVGVVIPADLAVLVGYLRLTRDGVVVADRFIVGIGDPDDAAESIEGVVVL